MSINQIAEDLKDIPQQKLIQYVQDPNSVVPQFLALAEIQRRKTLERAQGAGMPQSTVAQDIMKQAAAQGIQGQPGVMGQPGLQQQQGLPAMERPQGVAALPSGMGEMSYAGGGIIAFAGDEGSDVEDPYEGLSFEQKLKRLRAAEDEDTDASKNRMFRRNTPSAPRMGGFSENLAAYAPSRSADADAQAGGFYGGKAPAPTVAPDSLGRYVANSGSAPVSRAAAPGAPAPRIAGSAPTVPETTQAAPKEDMYSRYEQMLKGQAEEAKAGREQDKYMRIIEAGLGMMGGTSPYALTNIGQGAMGAVKGYAQDLAAARKEDAATVKELMGLGFKKEEAEREAKKLAIQEKLYAAHGKYYEAAAGAAGQRAAGAGTAANTRMTIAQEKNATALYNAAVKADPYHMQSTDAQKWAMAQQRAGMGGGSGGNIEPTVIPFSSLK